MRADEPNGTVKLSSGVVLRMRHVPRRIFMDIDARVPVPEVPRVFIEDKGREEENLDDPVYQRALDERKVKVALAQERAVLLMGTEVESIPNELQRPEDGGWKATLGKLDIEQPKDEQDLYLAWLRYVAAPEVEDYQKIWEGVARKIGVLESDVDATVRWFRR